MSQDGMVRNAFNGRYIAAQYRDGMYSMVLDCVNGSYIAAQYKDGQKLYAMIWGFMELDGMNGCCNEAQCKDGTVWHDKEWYGADGRCLAADCTGCTCLGFALRLNTTE